LRKEQHAILLDSKKLMQVVLAFVVWSMCWENTGAVSTAAATSLSRQGSTTLQCYTAQQAVAAVLGV